MENMITIGTVRAALVLYVVALALRLWGGSPWYPTARYTWIAGFTCYLAHVAAAFHWVHGWSHTEAALETARQTEEMFGIASGSGLWFNYAFTVVWAGDAVWSLRDPAGYEQRRPWVAVAVHTFLAFMFFNGAVVFATGFSRWFGLAATVALLLLVFRRREDR